MNDLKEFLNNIKFTLLSLIGTFKGKGRIMPKEWNLTFEDNFNDFDADTWMTEYYWGKTLNESTGEIQQYRKGNISVKNGVLSLTAKESKGKLPYSSGLIQTGQGRVYWHPKAKHTKGFTQKHGYFEIRCKLPKGKGLWSAFWLLTKDSVLPEIDIFESNGAKPNKIRMTYHHATSYESKHKIKRSIGLTACDFTKDFHAIGCEWNESKLIWYVDGMKIGSIKAETTLHKEVYPIANLAIFGGKKAPNKKTVFPASLQIDYIKIYKK